MGLFFDDSRPGPGVAPDAPRSTGLKRIWEMLSRDYLTFWGAGIIQLLLTFPFAFGVGLACATHSLLFALLAGIIGGMLAAPGFYGLTDTLLRSLRDEPGFGGSATAMPSGKTGKARCFPGR